MDVFQDRVMTGVQLQAAVEPLSDWCAEEGSLFRKISAYYWGGGTKTAPFCLKKAFNLNVRLHGTYVF